MIPAHQGRVTWSTKEDEMKRIQNWTTIGVLMLLMTGALAYIGWAAPAPSSADSSWPEPGPPGPQPQIPGYKVNQIVTELRVDQPEVSQTRHWSQELESYDTGPTDEGQNFTSGWFSLNIGSCPEDPECGFTQAGLLNNKEGTHWFVYSKLPITCDYGREMWKGKGCVGKLHELFGEDSPDPTSSAVIHFWRTEQAQWEIQIGVPPSPEDPDPARFSVAFVEGTGEEKVTRATSTFEAVFKDTGKHPKAEAHYFHYRPEYLKNETGGFEGEMVKWPASDENHRNQVFVFSSDGPFCPQIYSLGGYSSEFERWLTGSNGGKGDCHVDRLF
jgi:hypothetical protein